MLPPPWDGPALRTSLGFTVAELEAARHNETAPDSPPDPGSAAVLPEALSWRPLPYPGGRHPRRGFRDGAVNPRRETKLLFGIPAMRGYLVLDLPEAIWSNGELVFLAHTHVPTVWDREGERPRFTPWSLSHDGLTASSSHVLPDGSVVAAEASRCSDSRIDIGLTVTNGSDHELVHVWAQTCLMLTQADLRRPSEPEVVLTADVAALRLSDGKRVELTWERVQRTWQNPPVPCMHSDPFLGSCAPSDSATVHGSLTLG